VYRQSPFITTSLIRTGAEFLGKFKNPALGGSNLRTKSKNLRTASAQIFKAKNQCVDGPQKISKRVNYTGNLDEYNSGLIHITYVCMDTKKKLKNIV
jgi:hypothetical protein